MEKNEEIAVSEGNLKCTGHKFVKIKCFTCGEEIKERAEIHKKLAEKGYKPRCRHHDRIIEFICSKCKKRKKRKEKNHVFKNKDSVCNSCRNKTKRIFKKIIRNKSR